MNWEDKGFLLSKNKYSENSLIIDVFSKEHEKFWNSLVVLQKG